MKLLREAGAHLALRAASALLSSALFALIVRRLDADAAQQAFFFSFSVGFLAAMLRSFCLLQTNLQGSQRRSAKLRRVRAAQTQFLRLVPLLAAGLLAVLWLQPISKLLLLGALPLLLCVGLDADQVRAALGRSPHFSMAFAAGSLAGLLLMLGSASMHPGLAAAALLMPWLPVAAFNLRMGLRLAAPARRRTAASTRKGPAIGRPWAALALAAYDGLVLNLPFVFGLTLSTAAGFDMSVASRLFSSAQPFFPLVMHWSGSGALSGLSRRSGLAEPRLYASLLFGSGLAASLLFLLLFGVISGKPISLLQYGLFTALLLGYCIYAAAVRYHAGRLTQRARLLCLAITLALLALSVPLATALGTPWREQAAWLVAFQSLALLAAAGPLLLTQAMTRRIQRRS